MSDEQMSWENILQQTIQNPPPPQNSSSEVQARDASGSSLSGAAPEEAPERAPAKRPRAKRKTFQNTESASSTVIPEVNGAQVLSQTSSQKASEPRFSQKNWGRLEFPKTAVATPETAKAPSPSLDSGQKRLGAVEIPGGNVDILVEKSHSSGVSGDRRAQSLGQNGRQNSGQANPLAPPRGLMTGGEETGEIFSEADELSQAAAEPQVITVSELNKHIRSLLEGQFPLLWLKGEISNFKAHTSGHFYFSLKDSKAQIAAVMFKGFNSHLRFRPEDGMEVVVRGKITVYEPRGNYQIFCELMEPVGAGALQKAFEQLKAKLQKEGLFDAARKRPLPVLPKHIAIVTSPTGAAIRDMLNVLGRRFKGVRITVIPCKVQGDQAPKEIVAAIAQANRLSDVDVMIVGRGGGSIEDLWAFNDEGVARAIAAARVPVISAVGHEVDFTIADFVADLRAPTPSAAAELVVKNAADLKDRVSNWAKALKFAMLRWLNSAQQETTALNRRLVDPQRRIQDASLRCDELLQRLQNSMSRKLEHLQLQLQFESRLRTSIRHLLMRKGEALAKQAAVLDSLSPLKVLDRGYSMVTVADKVVTHAQELKVGQTVSVRMCQGSIEAEVRKIEDKR